MPNSPKTKHDVETRRDQRKRMVKELAVIVGIVVLVFLFLFFVIG